LRLISLRIIRELVERDEKVGVKFFKMKLLSNLITHTLKDLEGSEPEISELSNLFLKNKYRTTLLTESQEFKEEK